MCIKYLTDFGVSISRKIQMTKNKFNIIRNIRFSTSQVSNILEVYFYEGIQKMILKNGISVKKAESVKEFESFH